MKSSNLTNILKSGNIVIPMYMLKGYKRLNIELDEFIFLMYLYNKGNSIPFNPEVFCEDLGLDLETIMNYVSTLTDKKYIKLEVLKENKKLIEEVISLDDFYSKLSLLFSEEVNKEEQPDNIYEIIEKEFGRVISPIESEIISAWLETGYDKELIIMAIKEATYNGVSNLRYIDKILYEWDKKGFKSIEDIDKFKKKKKSTNDKKIDVELVDWDWFDNEE